MKLRQKNRKRQLLLLVALGAALDVAAQSTIWKNNRWECSISEKGTLEQIVFRDMKGNDTVSFFSAAHENCGPVFYARTDGKTRTARWKPDGYLSYRAELDRVECRLTYKEWKGMPAMEVTLENKGYVPFQPVKAGLKLGIDTYMERYPEWFGKYFPTLMMNEKTHFYGYLQTPAGQMLGIVSPQPVASWSVDYNLGYQDPAPHWFMGHRIESLNLDLLNALPLPDHCPQDLWQLRQGERKTWTVAFVQIPDADHYEALLHKAAGIPMIGMPQTTFRAGERAVFHVWGQSPTVTVTANGKEIPVTLHKRAEGVTEVACILPQRGIYTVRVADGGRVAGGRLSVHPSWRWTLEQARAGAWKYHQKPTSHVESYYGFHSAFLAARYFPDPKEDRRLRRRFDYIFDRLYDSVTMQPRYHTARIQNTASTIGMLVDAYEAYGDVADLQKAARLADWLSQRCQREDGAYVSYNTVYTSVIYVAKSVLELALAERELAGKDPVWQENFRRHYDSAKRAIDQLVAARGDFQTEGELTFEDGMVSCSALQIGMLALMQDDPQQRRHYTEAMLQILGSHDCLAQLRVPDARRRGGTMRYWEAQYDVQMLPNMFNSPHGWSAWRAYATYYAYLLTGEERWLRETYNAMGAFSHLIDYRTGELRWAFVVDPYLQVTQACSADTHVTADSLSFGNPHPALYDTRSFVIGEQYVNMISDWQTINTQDNDVHEVFKCMGEAMLTNAFVVERGDGTLVGYNCRVTRRGDRLLVEADEEQITHLHCNLKNRYALTFNGESIRLGSDYLGWAFGGDPFLD